MIGVVVPVYASTARMADTAREALWAQAAALPAWAALIVVHNGSDVPGLPEAHDVRLPINLGFTAAVNIGLRCAVAMGCDYYVVSSADVVPYAGDWLRPLVGEGLISASEADSDAHCDHDGVCPFWGGLFGFPQALLDDVGLLPEQYTRIGDAAFAARAATRGWSVTRSPMAVQHRHPHAANNAVDPKRAVITREKAMLARQYSDDVCALILDLNAMSPAERWQATQLHRGAR